MAAVNCCLCTPKKREKEVERRVREREIERGGELNSSRDTRQSHLLFLQSALCLHTHTHTLIHTYTHFIYLLLAITGTYFHFQVSIIASSALSRLLCWFFIFTLPLFFFNSHPRAAFPCGALQPRRTMAPVKLLILGMQNTGKTGTKQQEAEIQGD